MSAWSFDNADVDIASRGGLVRALAEPLLGAAPSEHLLESLRQAAARWALAGIPLDVLHHFVFECGRVALELSLESAGSVDGGTPWPDMIGVLELLSHTLAESYLAECGRLESETKQTVYDLSTSLLAGDGFAVVARNRGIRLAARYAVLVIAIPPEQDNPRPTRVDRELVDKKLRHFGDEITARCGPGTLARLDLTPGIVLVPGSRPQHRRLDEMLEQLTTTIGCAVSAIVIYAAPSEISEATANATKLLAALRRTGVHRYEDYALELQVIRPGAGLDALAGALTPLLEHPELMATLKALLYHNGYRYGAARSLHVHENTLTKRLHRIGQLTGIDPFSAAGIWRLRSAMVAQRAKASRL